MHLFNLVYKFKKKGGMLVNYIGKKHKLLFIKFKKPYWVEVTVKR